jgi:hypothetical protein
LHERSRELLKRDPVHLTIEQRQRAVEEIVRTFAKWKIELKTLGIGEIHLHALARVPDHNPRHWMGLAKKECSAYMKRDGPAPIGGLWGIRCECKPITGAHHFENADDYIRDHAASGAIIWPAPAPLLPAPNPMADFNPNDLLVD